MLVALLILEKDKGSTQSFRWCLTPRNSRNRQAPTISKFGGPAVLGYALRPETLRP